METSVFALPGVLEEVTVSLQHGSELSVRDFAAIESVAANEETDPEERRVANRILRGVRRGTFKVVDDGSDHG